MKCSVRANAASKMASLWLVTLSPAWARNVLNFSRAEGMLTARNVAPAGPGCQCDPTRAQRGLRASAGRSSIALLLSQ